MVGVTRQRVLLGQHNVSAEGTVSKMVLKGRHALAGSVANRAQSILLVWQDSVIKEEQQILIVGAEVAAVKPSIQVRPLALEVLDRLDTMTTLAALMPKVAVALTPLNLTLMFLLRRVVSFEPNRVLFEIGDFYALLICSRGTHEVSEEC